jgi:IclR family KDG regulon transcriptional repressor
MNPLHKVFAILETVVAKQATGATYSDILTRLDLPKSTVHRLLKDLVDIGYLNYDLQTKRYAGSFRLAELGSEVISKFQLRKHVRPFLTELHRETEHTSNLAILDGTTGVFIDKIEARDFGIKLFSEVGKTFPLYCTGLGKVLLAHSPEKLLYRLLERPLDAITDKTITDPTLLKEELSRIREQGYALDNEEITRGILCVAAPVFGYNREIMAAISIAFPAYIEKDRKITKEINAIKKYSGLISQSLGDK